MGMVHFVYPFISWWTFDCYRLLAFVTDANVNICVPVLFSVLLGLDLGAELLGHMVILYLVFGGKNKLVISCPLSAV